MRSIKRDILATLVHAALFSLLLYASRGVCCGGAAVCVPCRRGRGPARTRRARPVSAAVLACDNDPGSLRLCCVNEHQVCAGLPTCADLEDERVRGRRDAHAASRSTGVARIEECPAILYSSLFITPYVYVLMIYVFNDITQNIVTCNLIGRYVIGQFGSAKVHECRLLRLAIIYSDWP